MVEEYVVLVMSARHHHHPRGVVTDMQVLHEGMETGHLCRALSELAVHLQAPVTVQDYLKATMHKSVLINCTILG